MTKPKLQVFKDEKYIIVEYDALNYAILSLKRFEETQREDRSLIGYYPTLKSAIIRVLEMQIGDQLLEKVRRTGPFKSLDEHYEYKQEKYPFSLIELPLELLLIIGKKEYTYHYIQKIDTGINLNSPVQHVPVSLKLLLL